MPPSQPYPAPTPLALLQVALLPPAVLLLPDPQVVPRLLGQRMLLGLILPVVLLVAVLMAVLRPSQLPLVQLLLLLVLLIVVALLRQLQCQQPPRAPACWPGPPRPQLVSPSPPPHQ